MNVCVVITAAIVMLLRDFGSYVVIFMLCVFTALDFSIILDGQFTNVTYFTYDFFSVMRV
jgi:hypothetical protein